MKCKHVLEWHMFSGDFQMSETRRIVRQTPTLSMVVDQSHTALFLLQDCPWLPYVLAFSVTTLLSTENDTHQETHSSPCRYSTSKSRKCHYTCQILSLHIMPTISFLSLSAISDKVSFSIPSPCPTSEDIMVFLELSKKNFLIKVKKKALKIRSVEENKQFIIYVQTIFWLLSTLKK